MERFHFHRRNQEQGEPVLVYIAELRRLSATCDCGGYLKEVFRFVCGLSNEATQKRLLTERNLDLPKALGGGSGYGGGAKKISTVQRIVGKA